MDPLEFTPNAHSFGRLFRRDCVECPDVPLTCPTCPAGQICIQQSPTCTQCASRKCVPNAQSGATEGPPPKTQPSPGPNIGAIVGGVIGGVAFIAVVTFLIWFFFIKKKREQWEAAYDADYDRFSEKDHDRGTYAPTARDRSEATRSIASTAYTRGSNVIQIAFIPGVTGRNDPNAHTPPVPPIPSSAPHSPWSETSGTGGDHYFMPGDLRDSTYSGFTDDGASTIGADRRSTVRSIAPSIAPSLLRESVSSHVYREDTIANPMPAQTAHRGRANMVSVKGSANASRSPSVHTPPVPSLDRSKLNQTQTANSSESFNGHYVTPSSHNQTPGSGSSRPLSDGLDSPTIPTINVTSSSSSTYPSAAASIPSSIRNGPGPTAGASNASAFGSDAASVNSTAPHLKREIEEATRRASRQPYHGGLGGVRPAPPAASASGVDAGRDPSPFSDANRLSEGSTGDPSPRT